MCFVPPRLDINLLLTSIGNIFRLFYDLLVLICIFLIFYMYIFIFFIMVNLIRSFVRSRSSICA